MELSYNYQKLTAEFFEIRIHFAVAIVGKFLLLILRFLIRESKFWLERKKTLQDYRVELARQPEQLLRWIQELRIIFTFGKKVHLKINDEFDQYQIAKELSITKKLSRI